MPKISVVVPVYKVEQYLDRCVQSILNQTYRDFELILVDDGSPDRCGRFCDDYAAADSRVQVIHQKNGGLSAARNSGIDWSFAHSDSQWITFIDSDDWVHPRLLQWLLEAAEHHQVDVSICGFAETDRELPFDETMQTPELWKAERFYRERFINATVAWGKLYRKTCFEELRYPVGKIHEDEFTTYRVLFAQEQVAFIPTPMYFYYVNAQGITKSKWNPKRLHAWEAYEQQLAFFKEKGCEDLVKFRYRGFLENAVVNARAAAEAEETPEILEARKFIYKTIRGLLRRMWHEGCIDFWIDFDILYAYYPTWTRGYRLWLEVKNKLGGKNRG